MNIVDATRRMVRKYPGGVDALAPRLDKSSSTFDKELRGAPGFKLGVEDAHEASKMCHELGMPEPRLLLEAWAEGIDCFVMPLPPLVGSDGDACLKALADTSREAAELISEACAVLSDRKVTDNEMTRIDGAIGELIRSAQALRRSMAAVNAAGKPRRD